MNNLYKCTGSVVMWVLHNKLQRSFIIWMLAQRYDRKHNKRTTGYISDTRFLNWLADKMACQKRTARKRLEEAVQYGFLDDCGGRFLVRSHRKMIFIAMDDQQRRYSDDNCVPPPELFLKADRKFTRKLSDWIDSTDINRTVDLLSTIAATQNSVNFRGKFNQGKLINCHRSTIQRRNSRCDVIERERFIVLDVLKLLNDPSCGNKQAIRAFKDAEFIYRKAHNYLRGRQLIHQKTVAGKSFLAVQIPSVFYSNLDVKETPSIREAAKWLHLKSGRPGHCTATSPPDSPSGSPIVEWPERFTSSRNMGRADIPNKVVFNYLKGIEDILESDKCRTKILKSTGAKGFRSIFASKPSIWTSSAFNTTPKLVEVRPKI